MRPDFSAAGGHRVSALMSARPGGISAPPYDGCNLGDHVGDDPAAVAANRAMFTGLLAGHPPNVRPVWLTQVHGHRVVRLSREGVSSTGGAAGELSLVDPLTAAAQPEADGAITTEPGLACVVMVADCLPVLLAAPQGRGVAALHAGWRGLAGAGDMQGRGILHTGVAALCEASGADPADLHAWLGPCIGPGAFEVGADVLQGFGVDPAGAGGHARFRAIASRSSPLPVRWLADLPGLGRDTLMHLGLRHVAGGQWCTVSDASRFFSYRRDGVTGRQAAAICIR